MSLARKSSCDCSLGYAQQAPNPSDGQSTRRSVDVNNPTRTEVIAGPSLLELRHGPSSHGRVGKNRSRSRSAPCNFPPRSTLLSTRSCSPASTSEVYASPSLTSPSGHCSYGEESETEISVCETLRSLSTDDSITTSDSEDTQVSEPSTTEGDDDVISSKAGQFFDEDVRFPPVPSVIEGPLDFSLVEQVRWEDCAKRRIARMVEKEPVVASQLQVVDTGYDAIPLAVKQDIITWLIAFCALDTMENIDAEQIKLRAHQIGVACLMLACKVDVDFLAPLEMLEQLVLETLSYQVTFPTPCDFLTELVFAIPMLENLASHCVQDWQLVEEGFEWMYGHAYRHPEYGHYRSSVLTVAVLLFCLDQCIFDHPRSQTRTLGQVWWRNVNGVWAETRGQDSLEEVSCNLASDEVRGHWVNLSEAGIKTSICELMGLEQPIVFERIV
ncbi:uncharacterized protein MELLADRAFT_69723 [Melampsora larici-populina 98AG31]|uniref:Uncharacterized protein n=1 Tax=Melampsora larici-populina (strain 98AG31 / pathotype 3-4-7) TaxID=747676 RepID=F4SBX6_MELLP|nr:uncharacterized protein MELLADRAFT_69723 [Melampsora larici-populina 98AG31]EGF97847.1 hypothetical protein MELLADRAFT_69723 [Melampsora larici-populina 98AG31]